LDKDYGQNITSIHDENVSKKMLGFGKDHKMIRSKYNNDWRIKIKEIEKEEDIYYWLNIKTSDGKNYTSFVYKLTIEDLEEKYFMLESMKWGTFFSIVIGVILILGISWIYLNKPAENIKNKGIFVLGSRVISKPFERTSKNVSDLNFVRIRFLLLLICIIITILFLLISIYLGLFQDLIGETGG
jgi:ATP-dependent Zn protease